MKDNNENFLVGNDKLKNTELPKLEKIGILKSRQVLMLWEPSKQLEKFHKRQSKFYERQGKPYPYRGSGLFTSRIFTMATKENKVEPELGD